MADDTEKPAETTPEAPVSVAETPAAEATAPAEPAAPIAAAQVEPAPAPEAPRPAAPAAAAAKTKIAAPEPVPAPAPAKVTEAAKPAPTAVKAAPAKAPAPAREVKPASARAAKKTAVRTISVAGPKPAAIAPKSKSAPRKTFTAPKIGAAKPAPASIKENTMAKTAPTDFLASFTSYFADFQAKAKEAYEKSTAAFGEANDFAKGNVEAIVESGKILASGLQELSTGMVTDSRSAFETLTAEVKDLAAAKTPAEFFSLQSTLARKNFDAAVAQASKSTEAMLKLANEAVTPISGRVALAVEKVKKAA